MFKTYAKRRFSFIFTFLSYIQAQTGDYVHFDVQLVLLNGDCIHFDVSNRFPNGDCIHFDGRIVRVFETGIIFTARVKPLSYGTHVVLEANHLNFGVESIYASTAVGVPRKSRPE